MAAFSIVLATLCSYAIGWAIGAPILVPIVNTLASYPFMVLALKRGNLGLAVARMLIWALTMGVTATLLSYARPPQTDVLFLNGESYKTEMFAWVATGRGAESEPSQFVPQQAWHALLFSGLALATAGAAAMPMGAVLMNYMGHYAGTLAASSAHPALTLLVAWHPWAVIRVVSFVVIGVVLSVPLLSRLAGVRVDRQTAWRLLAFAGGGLIADVLLKTVLAPSWQRFLLGVVGW